ncbi:unnamed protein product [Coregonus sp. 'balchen']|nr:unnamed protein product [Coregonus sp. 'balchen']
MMSGEIIYSDVTFTRHQNQDAGAESEVSKGTVEGDEDVTYSEVRRPGGRAREQEDPGKGSEPGTSDPSPSVGSKAAIPEGGSRSVPVVTLVYASNMTSLHAEEARFNQMKENLTGKLHELQDNYKRLQNESHNITVQRELLFSELQDCKANLTRVKDLLATIQGEIENCVRIGQQCHRNKNCWFDFPCAESSKRICESRSVCESQAIV